MEGEHGLMKFVSSNKKTPRANPKRCNKLKSSIYGAPGANNERNMHFHSARIETCGLRVSEVEPSLYVKIAVGGRGHVVYWLICKIWTDRWC